MIKLYYNASHPIEILESLTIKTSKMGASFNHQDRGVSFSSRIINSHGAFTFAFKENRDWYGQFTQVEYGQWENGVDFTHKSPMLQDEYEWWSPVEVKFQLIDISYIAFRATSPAAKIFPRRVKKVVRALQQQIPPTIPYMEM